MDDKELIENYLLGKLSLYEVMEVENKIKNDAAFYEELNFQRDIIIGINTSYNLQLKEKLRGINVKRPIIRLSINRNTIARYAVAASIIAIVAISVLYPKINDATIIKSKRGYTILK